MKKMSRGFLPAVISCFLTSAVYSNTQPSCHLITDLVAKETAHIVTMTITSDWISTDLCVCYLSTSYDSTYLTFDLVAPSDSDAICGPYLTVEPISGSSFYNVCPRSGSSPHGATISNQSSITVALWSKDPNKSLLGANITFHSYIPMKLTCRQVNNSSLNLENVDCPCWKAQDFSSPRSIRQSDIDYSTRLMRGLVVSFSFLFVCGLLALFFTLNKRFHITERLKQKLSHFGSAAAQSVTHCGSRKSAFEASNSYDELATVIAQPIEDLTYEKIGQLTNTSETCNKASEKAISMSLHGYTNSGIYEEIPFEKLRDVGIAALGDTNSLCPYATSPEVRDLELRANLVGRGALSAGDICRWNYTSSTADHVLKPSVRMSVERQGKEPETEVIYGTVKKLKRTSGNGIHTESSTSDQDGVSSMLGQDLPFVIVSLFGGNFEKLPSSFAIPAAEYAKADLRWMRSDTSIVALELGTVLVETTLAYFVVRGVVYNTVYRQFVQTCASVLQVYRVWLVFGPEILSGFADINLSNPVHVMLYLVVYNLIWTLIPLLILYETYLDASTGVMRFITPYRTKSPVRASKRSLSTFRNRGSWFWHS